MITKRVAVFAALQWECRAVLHALRNVRRDRLEAVPCWVGTVPGLEVWVMKTGIGVRRAETAAAVAAGSSAFAVYISTGCAGALQPDLRAGDLAFATAVCGHGIDGELLTDGAYRTRATAAAAAAGLRGIEGPILCSAEVLATIEQKRAAAACGAIAVDMEGGPIAARAAAARVPFVAVRAVLDSAADELHVAGDFLDRATGCVRPMALARYVAMRPGAIPQLVALSRMQRAARDSLERFFTHWLAAPAWQ
ncbi:MAG: hypothetical protein AB7V27_17520 [Candidatus Binatia bacterium]